MLAKDPNLDSSTPEQTDQEGNVAYDQVKETEYIRSIHEVEYANTNGISQRSLNYIETAKIRELAG
jgi:hypothetical protein